MIIFDAYISQLCLNFFHENLKAKVNLKNVNEVLYNQCGILDFFEEKCDLDQLISNISENINILSESDRAEYGDFQTNERLALEVTNRLKNVSVTPDIVIEPTCGKGNFIIACLRSFDTIKKIYAVEIYKQYVWEAKFKILDYSLQNPEKKNPEIVISHCSVFDYDFKSIRTQNANSKFLIIGNPPWVTNSKLGSVNSTNLPTKSNFKNNKGLDAMTGKGNFDIAEFIALMMIETFQSVHGNLVFLIKNSVIKNILFDQKSNKFTIGDFRKVTLDSNKEFGVSVEASLLLCTLGCEASFNCEEFNFYNDLSYHKMGWISEKFVSNINLYSLVQQYDSECQYVWRQGVKHDSSAIMEFEKIEENTYINGLNEELNLESELVYSFLKSSDLKSNVIDCSRKFTIITQTKVGQETNYIKNHFPKTYSYLMKHLDRFTARKSSIYRNKPLFSIFGIGDYSFKPYKVAISGLYKKNEFTLVLPNEGKPIMVDDTCYILGFDNLDYAVFTYIILNSNLTKSLLEAVTFSDAKRKFTKDVLMRIDLLSISKDLNLEYIETELTNLNNKFGLNCSLDKWKRYLIELNPQMVRQYSVFDMT